MYGAKAKLLISLSLGYIWVVNLQTTVKIFDSWDINEEGMRYGKTMVKTL